MKCPKLKKSIYKYNGSEDELKKLVYTNGAVVAGIQFTNATGQKLYYFCGSSIFTDCSDDDKKFGENKHAVTVVGYGKEGGMNYWLIKNSWGPTFGDNGFLKLPRGKNSCGIGIAYTSMECCDLQRGDC